MNIETYWDIANRVIVIINIIVEGWLVYRYVMPFMKAKSHYVGLSYSLVMLIFFLSNKHIVIHATNIQ